MRRELKILLLASAMSNLAVGFFGPIYAVFVERIGGDLLTAGTAYSLFALSTGILIFFIGKWEDRVKNQAKLVVLGYSLSSLGILGYLFVARPWHLFIIQVILGIGGAIGTPAYDGLYSKNLDQGKFASEWGAWESMYWIVMAVAAAVGGFIANTFGFRILFMVMFVLSLLSVAASSLLMCHEG